MPTLVAAKEYVTTVEWSIIISGAVYAIIDAIQSIPTQQ